MENKFHNIDEEYEFSRRLADKATDKIQQDPNNKELFKQTILQFTKESKVLSEAGFACGIDSFKNMLSAKVDRFNRTVNGNIRELNCQSREEIATVMVGEIDSSGDKLTQQKQLKIIIQVITDFHKFQPLETNPYYRLVNEEVDKQLPEKLNPKKAKMN